MVSIRRKIPTPTSESRSEMTRQSMTTTESDTTPATTTVPTPAESVAASSRPKRVSASARAAELRESSMSLNNKTSRSQKGKHDLGSLDGEDGDAAIARLMQAAEYHDDNFNNSASRSGVLYDHDEVGNSTDDSNNLLEDLPPSPKRRRFPTRTGGVSKPRGGAPSKKPPGRQANTTNLKSNSTPQNTLDKSNNTSNYLDAVGSDSCSSLTDPDLGIAESDSEEAPIDLKDFVVSSSGDSSGSDTDDSGFGFHTPYNPPSPPRRRRRTTPAVLRQRRGARLPVHPLAPEEVGMSTRVS